MSVTIVCGPPCAGKTTHALAAAEPGDLVVDHDLIARDLGSRSTHHHGRAIRDLAEQWVEIYFAEIEAGLHPRAWVVRTLANPHDRDRLAARLGADILLLDPGADVCKARADATRERPSRTRYLIDSWYARANADRKAD